MAHFIPGDQIIWHYTPSGGYGYVQTIPGKVTKIGNKRIQIEIHKRNGSALIRWVWENNLEFTGKAYCDYCHNLYAVMELCHGKMYSRVCLACHDIGA
jgi:hypothetical protein